MEMALLDIQIRRTLRCVRSRSTSASRTSRSTCHAWQTVTLVQSSHGARWAIFRARVWYSPICMVMVVVRRRTMQDQFMILLKTD